MSETLSKLVSKEIVSGDAFIKTVIAPGLCPLILLNLSLHFSKPGDIVLMVNLKTEQFNGLLSAFRSRTSRKFAPRHVTYAFNQSERQEIYKVGGVISISGQILILDLLNGRLDPSTISRIIVYHGETFKNPNLQFSVAYIKKKNPHTFVDVLINRMVTARLPPYFSYHPFSSSHFILLGKERTDKYLNKDPLPLKTYTIQVSETESAITRLLLKLLSKIYAKMEISERFGLSAEDFALTRHYVLVARELYPHLKRGLNKNGLRDYVDIRFLLDSLYHRDPFEFSDILQAYKEEFMKEQQRSVVNGVELERRVRNWMLEPEADEIFGESQRLLEDSMNSSSFLTKSILLIEILKKISATGGSESVVVVCENPERMSLAIAEVIDGGLMQRSFVLSTATLHSSSEDSDDDDDDSSDNATVVVVDDSDIFDPLEFGFNLKVPVVLSRPSEDLFFLLRQVNPTRIICFTVTRNAEQSVKLYHHEFPNSRLKRVYRLCTEKYLKKQFDYATRTEARLMKEMEKNIEKLEATRVNSESRSALAPEDPPPSMTIVLDSREFLGSPLPFTLFQRGFNLEAAMLKTGDFYLTNEICIERKTPKDFMGSVKDSRVFSQLRRMRSQYRKTALLLDFSNEDFKLENSFVSGSKKRKFRARSKEYLQRSLLSNLVKIIVENRGISIIWGLDNDMISDFFGVIKERHKDEEFDVEKILREQGKKKSPSRRKKKKRGE